MVDHDVFILGAGFSKSIHYRMPTTQELTDIVWERLQQCEYELPPPLKNFHYPEKQIENNIELWMTYLYAQQPWLECTFNKGNQNLAEKMRALIGEIIAERTVEAIASPCPPDWLNSLIREWHVRKAVVISLNYDTLIESIAAETASLELNQLYPYLLKSEEPDALKHPKETFEYYKLHGSVNWYLSNKKDGHDPDILYCNLPNTTGDFDGERLIIPPVTEKTKYFNHATVRKIWEEAGKKLERATRVFVIGYSLPLSDLGMQFFLKRYQPGLCAQWYIVNPDVDVTKKYQRLLSPVQSIVEDFACEVNPVRKFSHFYCETPTVDRSAQEHRGRLRLMYLHLVNSLTGRGRFPDS